jgi:hypothetical protein
MTTLSFENLSIDLEGIVSISDDLLPTVEKAIQLFVITFFDTLTPSMNFDANIQLFSATSSSSSSRYLRVLSPTSFVKIVFNEIVMLQRKEDNAYITDDMLATLPFEAVEHRISFVDLLRNADPAFESLIGVSNVGVQ